MAQSVKQEHPSNIIGIELRTNNQQAFDTIPLFWEQFFSNNCLEKIPNKQSENIFAVYINFENEGQNNKGEYSLIIGAQVVDLKTIPDGFISTIIPPSNRKVFEVEKGRSQKVGEKWQEIWKIDTLEKTFICDYELYKPSGEIAIYVGVK